jgi:hypothetical protein
MRIEREGDRVEIRRNKRRGLKLKIMEASGDQVCRNCILWKNTTGICGIEVEKNLDPCVKLELDKRSYFAYEG